MAQRTSNAISTDRKGGPRTQIGKNRCKYNSLKHGIFSSVALLKGEPRSEFDSLLRGFRKTHMPEGVPEEVLVELLVVLLWKIRRLLIAEVAEIQSSILFPRRDNNRHVNDVHFVVKYEDEENYGHLMQKIANPHVSERERCLELLKELERGIRSRGFDSIQDSDILAKLYGKCETTIKRTGLGSNLDSGSMTTFGNEFDRENGKETLFERYRAWASAAKCSEEERQRNGSPSSSQCTENFLIELQDEVRGLERYRSIESETMELEALRQCIPDGPRAEIIDRYLSSFLRCFDRTLSQLERLQRMRKGQPIL